ncbi:MAG: hypothetical protein ACRDST_08240 [Pseudonocardiaceae bacterium]
MPRCVVLNAEVYGVAAGVRTVHADVRSVDLTGVDAVFVDPARRSGGRRLRTDHGEPTLAWCLGLAQAVPAVGIKLAPGLDRSRPRGRRSSSPPGCAHWTSVLSTSAVRGLAGDVAELRRRLKLRGTRRATTGHDPHARSAVEPHLRRCDDLTGTGICWFDHLP